MCFQPYEDSAKLCLNVTTFQAKKRGLPIVEFRGPMLLEVFAKKGTYTPDKVVMEYEPRDLEQWDQGLKVHTILLRAPPLKKKFVCPPCARLVRSMRFFKFFFFQIFIKLLHSLQIKAFDTFF